MSKNNYDNLYYVIEEIDNLPVDASLNKYINIKDGSRRTLAMYAIGENRLDILKRLYKAGANPNSQDCHGWTDIMYAFSMLNKNAVLVCLENNADLSIKTKKGHNIEDIAKKTYNSLKDDERKLSTILEMFEILNFETPEITK